MKKILFLFFLLTVTLGLTAQITVLPKPNPPSLVVDNANVLDAYDRDQLERKLVALDDSTSNQISIVTIHTLQDEPIEDLAVNTFRSWGIGNKKTNNGVLILVAVDDHKVRIEVGYGLEGAIPDMVANDIIQKDLKPAFKQNNYYAGFNLATDDLSKAAAGEYKVSRNRDNSPSGAGSILKFILIIGVVLFFLMMRGGGRGGGGGWMAPMLLGGMLGGMGRGGGGSDWGGDSGGGGFGGFGGGSSGGGGASGSW
jgi:uncharacterized protein